MKRTQFLSFAPLLFAPMALLAAERAGVGWQIDAPVVTYWAGPMPMTDAAAKQMADGNWNLAWVTKQGLPAGGDLVAHYRNQLDILQRHRLRGIVALGLWNLDDPEKKSQLDAVVDGVRTHPALYAYSLKDEPNPSLFPDLARMRAYLSQRDPSRLAYVNLYPIYASNKQLGTEGEPLPAYREHLRRFVEQVRPQLLSYDHYPFAVRPVLPEPGRDAPHGAGCRHPVHGHRAGVQLDREHAHSHRRGVALAGLHDSGVRIAGDLLLRLRLPRA